MLLGCCAETKRFLKRIGTLGQVDFHAKLNVAGDERLAIKAAPLPAPLHLLPSILATSYLSRSQKSNLVRVLGRMLASRPKEDETARSYLKSLGCWEALMERLIDPVIVSALNEPAAQASAKYARMVMVESLLKGRGSYRLGVPKVPQSVLIGDAALRWLEARGCEVRLSARVRRVRIADGRAREMELASGEMAQFDAYVAAVPPMALERMGIDAGKGKEIRWRPILSAHLFYEGQTPPFEPACVVGEPFGWVFSRQAGLGYVEAVASAADGISHLEKPDLLAMAYRAVATAERMLGQIPLRRGIVYRAHRATFATLGCDACRPRAAGTAANLSLAGDWTATGWPATIESAVRSGLTAAKEVLHSV